MSEAKTVEEWAAAKAIEHWEVAGLLVHQRWDREPGKVVTEKELDAALTAFRGVTVGVAPPPPKTAPAQAEAEPLDAKAKKKGEVG